MKYYLLVGEKSGDLYGAGLMRELSNIDPQAEFRFWGGLAMKKVSNTCDKSIEETSFMGIVEVLQKLPTISKLFKRARLNIIDYKPDIVICIDYPGFNLRMAKWCSRNNIKVGYYISPQIWAWRKYRYKTIKQYTDLFFIILPFEQKLYQSLGVSAHYYGHPLLENIKPELINNKHGEINTIGLFPGSRIQEINRHVPILLEFARQYKNKKFYLSTVDNINKGTYLQYLNPSDTNVILEAEFENLLRTIDFAIAGSGTVTLELALYEIPQIVVYKASTISFAIAQKLINLDHISLVNLIAQKTVTPELIQDRFNVKNLLNEFQSFQNPETIDKIIAEYRAVKTQLGSGQTSKNIAEKILSFLKSI